MKALVQLLREKIRANPPGLYVLFYTEMWELFGRFGITSLLVLYLTQTFHFTDARSFAVYSSFIALIYATPILGGYLSDKFLGKTHAVVFGGVIMVLGNCLLIIPNSHSVLLGLAIIAVGSGFLLPSIAPMVGALYDEDVRGRDAGFTLYYLGKNIGALLAPIFCGIIGELWGYNYAFILSGLGMISGIIVFLMGQKHLTKIHHQEQPYKKIMGINGRVLSYTIGLLLIPFIQWILVKNLDSYLLIFAGIVAGIIMFVLGMKNNMVLKKRLVAIVFIMFAVVVFEAFLGQGGTTLNLFIQRIIHRQVFDITLPTSAFYALDPIFMLLLGPFLADFWLSLAKKKREPIMTTKFSIGLVLLALGFMVFVKASHSATITGQANLAYVIFAYFIFPIAELCIIPISLSMVTRLAPKNLESLLVGIWMLSQSISSFFTGKISDLGQVNFSLDSVLGRQHAAHIYQHLFLWSAIVLAATAFVIFIIGPLVQKLMSITTTENIA